VQNDINEGKIMPGQYFVLKYDFSTIRCHPAHAEANRTLIKSLNEGIKKFYHTYATHLGEDVARLCGTIESEDPGLSLQRCDELVKSALLRAQKQENSPLASVQGIYLLVDECDAFTNTCLETSNIAEPDKTAWDSTPVGLTFKSFWSTVKSLCSEKIRKVFITGISPLSLSGVGSAFNVARNLSFHQDLAGLCGLTFSDLEAALKEIGEDDKPDKPDKFHQDLTGLCGLTSSDIEAALKEIDEDDKHDEDDKPEPDEPDKPDKHLSEMTKFFNGYHFCKKKRVETVYNTETCLTYLQSIVDGGDLETTNPPNSEVAEQFLEKFATSASVITDFEKALQCDKDGDFVPLEYCQWKSEFTLRELVC
jgi:hypothetical protein